MTPNPFQALGIAPEGLRGLNDEQIVRLVEVSYGAWSAILHPDVAGGDRDQFELVARARDALKNASQAERAALRKEHQTPVGARIKQLQAETTKLQQRDTVAGFRLLEFWQLYYRDAEVLPAGAISVFSLPQCRLLFDAEAAIEIEIGVDSSIVICSQRPVSDALVGLKLLGSIPDGVFRASFAQITDPSRLLGVSGETSATSGFLQLSWETFRIFCSVLTPKLTSGAQVVGIVGSDESDMRFVFLGKLREIG